MDHPVERCKKKEGRRRIALFDTNFSLIGILAPCPWGIISVDGVWGRGVNEAPKAQKCEKNF